MFNDRIIGEGYHKKYGGPHAEIEAINSVSPDNKKYIPEATLYVSLEPCSHHGKTPPCAHRIIEEGIPKIVIAVIDPTPLVAGKGVDYLKSHGAEVLVHEHPPCRNVLDRFYIHLSGHPFVTLKWAQSSDFFLGRTNQKTAISQPHTQVLVHKWRSEHDGIMAGKNTILTDLPRLDVRYYPGVSPVRIIMDTYLSIPDSHPIYSDGLPVIIINQLKEGVVRQATFVKVPNTRDMSYILKLLFKMKIYSLLVEGGSELHQSFILSNHWHKACLITNTQKLSEGVKGPHLTGHLQKSLTLGSDTIHIIKNNSHYE